MQETRFWDICNKLTEITQANLKTSYGQKENVIVKEHKSDPLILGLTCINLQSDQEFYHNL